MKQFFIDLETTGLDPEHDSITEVCIIYYRNGRKIDMFSKVNAKPKEVITFLNKHIDKYDPKDKGYFIGQNAKFDCDFMHKFLNTSTAKFGNYFYHIPVDVMQLAAYKFMKRKRIPKSFSLSGLAKELKIPFKENSLHGAEYDIKLTRKVFLALEKL